MFRLVTNWIWCIGSRKETFNPTWLRLVVLALLLLSGVFLSPFRIIPLNQKVLANLRHVWTWKEGKCNRSQGNVPTKAAGEMGRGKNQTGQNRASKFIGLFAGFGTSIYSVLAPFGIDEKDVSCRGTGTPKKRWEISPNSTRCLGLGHRAMSKDRQQNARDSRDARMVET